MVSSVVPGTAQTDFDHCKMTAKVAKITLRLKLADDKIKEESSAMIIK